MNSKLKTIIFFSILFLFKVDVVLSQTSTTFGKEFWFSFMEAGPNGNNQFSVFISSMDSGIARLTSPAGDLDLEISYLSNSVTEIVLPDSIWYPVDYGEVTRFGLKLESSTAVTAYTAHLQVFQSETSILYPIEIIGSEYLITTASQSSHSYIIIATVDNTEIRIVNFNDTINIILNKGETYQVFSNDDPSGTRISAIDNKKIAIFSGARFTKMCGSEGGNNHLYEQLLPLNFLGKEYVIIPFADQGAALFKVLATKNNTEILLGHQFLANLNANESIEFNLDEPSILKSDEEIQVSQVSCHYDSIGDPSLLHLIPTSNIFYDVFIPSIVGFGSMPETFTKRYLNLITKTAKVNNIMVNNEIVDSEFQQVESDSSYSFAYIQLEGNSHRIKAPDGVYGYSYGFGNLDAYTFSIGFEEEIATSIKDEMEFNYTIYPNPAKDIIYINCTGMLEVDIFDLLGRKMHHSNLENSNSCNISHLANGLYIVNLKKKESGKISDIVSYLLKN